MAGVIILLISIIVLVTYFVGDYFIRYALVPKGGAEKRVVVSDEDVAPAEESAAAESVTTQNYQKNKKLKEQWLQEMEVEKREVAITSHDGLTLRGHKFEQEEPTDEWFIVVHGYQSNEDEAFTIGHHFYKKGYNVLTVDLRAHGDSEGKYIGMGYLDKDDLLSWTDYLVDKHPQSQIIYHGTSMGGATVLMAAGLELPANVKAVISDCSYTSIWDIFASEAKQRFDLPPFPVMHMAQIMGRIRAGYNMKDGDVTKFVAKSSLPILFIHTKADDFVPVSMVYDLYAAKTNGPKELYILEDGGHAAAKYVNPKQYYENIYSFVEEYL